MTQPNLVAFVWLWLPLRVRFLYSFYMSARIQGHGKWFACRMSLNSNYPRVFGNPYFLS
jgi:hypothetical protein